MRLTQFQNEINTGQFNTFWRNSVLGKKNANRYRYKPFYGDPYCVLGKFCVTVEWGPFPLPDGNASSKYVFALNSFQKLTLQLI